MHLLLLQKGANSHILLIPPLGCSYNVHGKLYKEHFTLKSFIFVLILALNVMSQILRIPL
jgi:hypothetical protein